VVRCDAPSVATSISRSSPVTGGDRVQAAVLLGGGASRSRFGAAGFSQRGDMISRVNMTERAAELLSVLCQRHGSLLFHQSGGVVMAVRHCVLPSRNSVLAIMTSCWAKSAAALLHQRIPVRYWQNCNSPSMPCPDAAAAFRWKGLKACALSPCRDCSATKNWRNSPSNKVSQAAWQTQAGPVIHCKHADKTKPPVGGFCISITDCP